MELPKLDRNQFTISLGIVLAIVIAGALVWGFGQQLILARRMRAEETRLEQMVAADEIIDMVKRILRGIPVNDESVALDIMATVGPGGHYLDTEHTYKRFRTEIWQSKLIDRQNWEGWTLSGSKRYGERANACVKEILESETEPLFDEATHKELRRICELADKRHKDE